MNERLAAKATLWPNGRAGWPRRVGHGAQRMVAHPDAVDARQIIPWRWSSLRATASRASDDHPRSRRLRNTLGLAGLLSVGAIPARRRFTADDERSVVQHIARELGHARVHAIALCGPPRANQKPVLQLHDGLGRTIAFVKVGWSDLTQRLIDDEHAALTHLASIRDRGFLVPEVAGRGSFGDLEWLALTPLDVADQSAPDAAGVDRLARLIEATGTSNDDPSEAHVVRSCAESCGLELASDVVRRLGDRPGDRQLRCGASHGDFVPWNMLTGRSESAVWDWERYRLVAPVGLDRLHFKVQIGIRGDRAPLASVLRDVAGQLGSILPDVDPVDRARHLDWYVADLLIRYERDALDDPSGRLPGRVLDLHQFLKERLESP